MNQELKDKSSDLTPERAAEWEDELDRLQVCASEVLDRARERGASAAEVDASHHRSLSVTVRMGEVETLEYSRDSGLGITVYFGQRKGSASSADLSPESIETSLEMACDIARYTEADDCNGLADAERMATAFPDLDLWHPSGLTAEAAIELARDMEQTALEHHPLIRNSEGGSVSSGLSLSVYANSHGFRGSRHSTRHSLSCVVLAQDDDSMQRDYWYDSRRAWQDLESARDIGRKAAERAVRRHGAGGLKTVHAPVLFAPEVAKTLLRHLVAAISGGNLYRRSSFLLDRLGDRLFPDFVQIGEYPFEPRGLRSTAFDNEGVATAERSVVADGVLEGYVLASYSARKLGLPSTGNAGGTHNLTLAAGEQDLSGLLSGMGTGLLVTELMGQGVNILTGDYSRGASGFWVENGEIQRPVEGVTIAGHLGDMFAAIEAVGNDIDTRSGIRCGSILIGKMTVAGD